MSRKRDDHRRCSRGATKPGPAAENRLRDLQLRFSCDLRPKRAGARRANTRALCALVLCGCNSRLSSQRSRRHSALHVPLGMLAEWTLCVPSR